MIGSEEHTPEQFEEIGKAQEAQVQLLEKVASTSASARAFLSTELGKAVRETISSNKLLELTDCAKMKDDDLANAQFKYAVWEKVEQVFGVIIVGGDEAIRELQSMQLIESDDQE